MAEKLAGTDLHLRVAREGDATDIAAIYAPHVDGHFTSFEETAPAAEDMALRLAAVLPQYPWIVAEQAGSVAGYAYASRHRDRHAYRWSVDVAVYLRAEAQRRGLGRRLYSMLFELLRAQNYVSAYAGIALPNQGSVRLHEAMGFRLVGVYERVGFKAGRWRDVGWWQLNLQPGEDPPKEPVPFAQLRSAMDL